MLNVSYPSIRGGAYAKVVFTNPRPVPFFAKTARTPVALFELIGDLSSQ